MKRLLHGALAKFDQAAFDSAGFPSFVRPRFAQIAGHEQVHVNFLSTALGAKATKPCVYNFPYTDVKSFVALSQVFEGVGVSAYTGAARLISNKDYLTAASSVLATEARHASWVAAAVNNYSGWGEAFDTPLDLDEVYTVAATVIKSCPSTNPTLPVHAFPPLSLGHVTAGSRARVEHTAAKTPTHVAFFSGLDKIFVPIDGNSHVVVPQGLNGQVYAVATTSLTEADDSTIVAGPAVLDFENDPEGRPLVRLVGTN
ncbi:ferritin-like domain-containing protein [Gymnopilus junonius]|uniref:Ferritin-like domain-containing protein n=1 Tax=Gymnopilus junonius TaxID=109634 RepID=A0A9P5NY51_GYMJU|nr:ferritin-like domain-containing protein [Gymnopilus junonius]